MGKKSKNIIHLALLENNTRYKNNLTPDFSWSINSETCTICCFVLCVGTLDT